MPEEIKEIMSCGSTKVLLKPVKANQVEAAIQGEWWLIHGAICACRRQLTIVDMYVEHCRRTSRQKPIASSGVSVLVAALATVLSEE
jgi:hypothetical protein